MIKDKELWDDLINKEKGGRKNWLWIVILLLLIAVIILSFVFLGNKWFKHSRIGSGSFAALIGRDSIDPSDPGKQLLRDARALMAKKSWFQARDKCYEILDQSQNPKAVTEAESILGVLNIDLLISPIMTPDKEIYLVQKNDSFIRIAKKFGANVDLLRKCNPTLGPVIHPGDRMRVFKGKFSIAISKSRNDLVLYMNDLFFKRYKVGTGKYGTTPTGTFTISDKIPEPPWWRPGNKVVPYGNKENILGTRWMSLTATEGTPDVKGYGIHGTWEPKTIGQQSSAGCVRLTNNDVEEIFMLIPRGVLVVISE